MLQQPKAKGLRIRCASARGTFALPAAVFGGGIRYRMQTLPFDPQLAALDQLSGRLIDPLAGHAQFPRNVGPRKRPVPVVIVDGKWLLVAPGLQLYQGEESLRQWNFFDHKNTFNRRIKIRGEVQLADCFIKRIKCGLVEELLGSARAWDRRYFFLHLFLRGTAHGTASAPCGNAGEQA